MTQCAGLPDLEHAEFVALRGEVRLNLATRLGQASVEEHRDAHPETLGHEEKVAAMIGAAACQEGLSEDLRVELMLAGGAHDFGKTTRGLEHDDAEVTNEMILRYITSDSKLTPKQRAIVEFHSLFGWSFLRDRQETMLAAVALFHHCDPGTLKILRNFIPLLADMVTVVKVADRFEAMTDVKGRPYLKNTLPKEGLARVKEDGSLQLHQARIARMVLSDYPPATQTFKLPLDAIVAQGVTMRQVGIE